VMKLSENRPPASNPLKGKWMMSDLAISSRMYQVKFSGKLPNGFPGNTVGAMRCLMAMRQHPAYLNAFEALFVIYSCS
jgi:2-hydroxychromene-2-carboxylate isomerase